MSALSRPMAEPARSIDALAVELPWPMEDAHGKR